MLARLTDMTTFIKHIETMNIKLLFTHSTAKIISRIKAEGFRIIITEHSYNVSKSYMIIEIKQM